MAELAPAPLPPPTKEGIPLDRLLTEYPAIRQSILAKFDDCPLSALFEMRYSNGWSTHPQAGGTIFHRFAAEFLRTLRASMNADGTFEHMIDVSQAFEILYEVMRQREVPLHERVRVPVRDIPKLHIAVKKFAATPFSVHKIVDIERRLWTTLEYPHPDGGVLERTVTGQLDVLLFEPPDGAIVIDWKHTWQPPAEHKDTGELDRNPERRLSYEGYFQQRFYALLVMANYSNINWVELREFYPLRGKVRKARITRANLEHVVRELALAVEALDEAVMVGTHAWTEPDAEGTRNLVEVAGTGQPGDAWPAEPGRHCGFCAKPGACPIEREARGEGAISSWEQAHRYAAEFVVATRVRSHRMGAAKAWVSAHGSIPVKDSKGRRMLGWVAAADGSRNFGVYVPDESDRGPKDPLLEQAMRESVAEAREQRDAARRSRRSAA